MKKKANTIGLLIMIMYLSTSVSAQELGLNFLQADQLYNGRNSAVPFPKKTIIGLPDASGHLFNEAGGFDNWINNKNISLENFWSVLDRRDYTAQVSWRIRTLSFGKKYTKFQWGVSHSFDGESNFKYHKDLVGLLAFGNYGLLEKEPLSKNQALSLTPDFNTIFYQSLHLETAVFLNENLSIGGGLKLISGIYNTVSDISKFDLDIRDPFVIKSNEQWNVKTSNLIRSLSIDSINISGGQADIGKNPGLAFNLGIYKQTDKLKFGAQIRDLGIIKWNGELFSRSGQINYNGVQINDILTADKNIFNQVTDTLKKISTISKESSKYTTAIRSKIIVDALCSIHEKFSVGGAALYQFNAFDPYWKIAGTGLYESSKVFSIGSQVSYDKFSQFSIGLYGALNVSIFRFYTNVDHLPVLINPTGVNRFNGNIGLALVW